MSSSPHPDISVIFGGVLKQFRAEREMSQEDLAFLAGLDRTFVSRLERGVRQPTITTLVGIALALEVSAAEMIRETEQEYLKQVDTDKLSQLATLVKERHNRYTKTPKKS